MINKYAYVQAHKQLLLNNAADLTLELYGHRIALKKHSSSVLNIVLKSLYYNNAINNVCNFSHDHDIRWKFSLSPVNYND